MRRVLTALGCGILLALAVPPYPLGVIVPLLLALSFWGLEGLQGKRAFGWGMLQGVGFNLAALWWIRNVASVGPVLVLAIALALLVGFLSLFHGLWAWGFTKCRDRRHGLWFFPFFWAAIEILRSHGEFSFPWALLGYALGDYPVLLQGASLVGVYGTGLFLCASAVMLWALFRGRVSRRCGLLVLAAMWGLWGGGGAWRYFQASGAGAKMSVAMVQPAIPQTSKWNEGYYDSIVHKTFATLSRVPRAADLWVLPETAIPDFWDARPREAYRLQAVADSVRAPLLVGVLSWERDAKALKGVRYRNSSMLLAPGRDPYEARRYDKMYLVPFSERLPFTGVFPILSSVNLGQADFTPGEVLPVVPGRVPWAPGICYEVIYPSFAREAARKGARMLVNISNDGWFGRSPGPWQHWNIQRFRAVESGLSIVQVANTGITGVVDPWGRILAQTELMADTALVVDVPAGLEGGSFQARWGGLTEILLLLVSLGGVVFLALSSARPGTERERAVR